MADPALRPVPRLRELLAEYPDLDDRALVYAKLLKEMNGSVEGAQKFARLIQGGDALTSRLITNDFEERIVALERKMRDLETTK